MPPNPPPPKVCPKLVLWEYIWIELKTKIRTPAVCLLVGGAVADVKRCAHVSGFRAAV